MNEEENVDIRRKCVSFLSFLLSVYTRFLIYEFNNLLQSAGAVLKSYRTYEETFGKWQTLYDSLSRMDEGFFN